MRPATKDALRKVLKEQLEQETLWEIAIQILETDERWMGEFEQDDELPDKTQKEIKDTVDELLCYFEKL